MNKLIGIDWHEGDMIYFCNVYFLNSQLTHFPWWSCCFCNIQYFETLTLTKSSVVFHVLVVEPEVTFDKLECCFTWIWLMTQQDFFYYNIFILIDCKLAYVLLQYWRRGSSIPGTEYKKYGSWGEWWGEISCLCVTWYAYFFSEFISC